MLMMLVGTIGELMLVGHMMQALVEVVVSLDIVMAKHYMNMKRMAFELEVSKQLVMDFRIDMLMMGMLERHL